MALAVHAVLYRSATLQQLFRPAASERGQQPAGLEAGLPAR